MPLILLLLGGVLVYALATKKSDAAPGSQYNIVDKNSVSTAQVIVSKLCVDPASIMQCDYGKRQGDIDGIATNPRFVSALSLLQKTVNARAAANPAQFANVGVTFPLRMDGVLDAATFLLLQNA